MANQWAVGNLHTGSAWIKSKSFKFKAQKNISNNINTLSARKEALAAKEESFYNGFGAKGFDDFINKVRGAANEATTGASRGRSAADILKKYCNISADKIDPNNNYAYIHTAIEPAPSLQGQIEEEVRRAKQKYHMGPPETEINIEIENSDNSYNFTNKTTNFSEKQIKSIVMSGFQLNPKEVEKGINKALNKTGNNRIKNMNDVYDLITGVLNENNIFVNGQSFGVDQYTNYYTLFSQSYPFLDSNEIQIIENMNLGPTVQRDLDLIKTEVKNFIVKKLGYGSGSIKLQNKQTLSSLIEECYEEACFKDGVFLLGGHPFTRKDTQGKGFYSNIKGVVGEFASLLWTRFITIQLAGNQANTIESKSTGSEEDTWHSSGKQTKQRKQDTSVNITQDITRNYGIQVKNYNITNALKSNLPNLNNFNTTAYGDVITQYLDFGGDYQEEFMTLIANAAFNKSFRDYFNNSNYAQEVIDAVKYTLDGLFNLATIDSVSDTVTFYLIDNYFLIPGSAILAAAIKESQNINSFMSPVTIGYSNIDKTLGGRTDEQFQEDQKKAEETDPNLVNWWWERNTDPEGPTWKGPGALNKQPNILQWWAGRASFKSGFKYTQFISDLEKGIYAIF
jgi:hypothetical protein